MKPNDIVVGLIEKTLQCIYKRKTLHSFLVVECKRGDQNPFPVNLLNEQVRFLERSVIY